MDRIIINEIEIELIKKKVKNTRLSVHPPNGRVRLVVPNKVSNLEIRDLVISNLPWIKKQKEKFANQQVKKTYEFISGEEHYLFGNKYKLNIVESSGKQYVELDGEKHINLYIKENTTRDKREKLMREWYRQELKNIIPEYIKKWESIIGVEVHDWGVKLMKTRWGTCNIGDKRIWINLEFAKKKLECLDYIIVHEMVHLLERKHNYKFKAYMDKFLPNWKKTNAELNGLIYES